MITLKYYNDCKFYCFNMFNMFIEHIIKMYTICYTDILSELTILFIFHTFFKNIIQIKYVIPILKRPEKNGYQYVKINIQLNKY